MAIFSEQIKLLIDAKTAGAVTPLKELETQAKKTDTAWDKAAKNIGLSGETLKKGLAAGATALVGVGLAQGVRNIVTGYAEAAKAAGDLAGATGSTVESVSRMQAALQDAGVSAEASAAMLTKFTQAASTKKGAEAIEALNVEFKIGRDGVIDYGQAMVDSLDAILKIGDASQRSAQLTTLFGKQGAKAFQDMIASGMTLSEAMEAINKNRIFTSEDVRRAAEFDEAMDGLAANAQTLGRELGRTLVPLLNDMLRLVQPLVSALASLDGTTVLLAGSAVALAANQGRIVAAVALAGGALRALGNFVIKPLTVDFTGLGLAAGASAKAIDATTAVAGRRGAAGLVSGLTKGLLLIGVAWEVGSRAVSAYHSKLEEVLATSDEINDEMARMALESMSFWERRGFELATFMDRLKAGLKGGFGKPSEEFETGLVVKELQAMDEAAREAARAQGAYSVAALESKDAQAALNEMMAGFMFPELAESVVSQQDLAAAIDDAATKAYRQEAATKAVKDAMDAALTTTEELTEATLASFSTDIAHERALFRRRDAVKEAVKATEELRDLQRQEDESREEYAERQAAAQRKVAESILEVKEASLDAAEAYVAERTAREEAAGQFVTDAEKRRWLIESLQRQLETLGKTDATKKARESIQTLIADLEKAELPPLKIGGIAFKQGTPEAVVADLQTRISRALDYGDLGLATRLQAELDSLKVPPQPVTLVGADGKPLGGDVGVRLDVDTTEVDSSRAALDGLAGDREVRLQTTVHNVENTLNVLNGLVGNREAQIHAVVYNEQNSRNVLDGLAERRTAEIHATVMNEKNSRNVLDGLSEDRTVHVNIVYRRFGTPPGSGAGESVEAASLAARNAPQAMRALMAPQFSPSASLMAAGTAPARYSSRMPTASGVTYAPTVIMNYPEPEPASDSIAMALRVARYTGIGW